MTRSGKSIDDARAAMGENRERQRQETAAMHRLENQRDKLLADGDGSGLVEEPAATLPTVAAALVVGERDQFVLVAFNTPGHCLGKMFPQPPQHVGDMRPLFAGQVRKVWLGNIP